MICNRALLVEVLQSGAGYYIGTMYKEPVTNFVEPNCRISGYFATKEEAEARLEDGKFERRDCVENQFCGCWV
jgi:hypothetical protein